jgi:hypothetical protein
LSHIVADFKAEKNPQGLQAAAVQVDVVGHSMGGDITRTLPLLDQMPGQKYLTYDTFGKGIVHKLITIDTPHLGSPLANDLLIPANGSTNSPNNICTASIMILGGNDSFNSVSFSGYPTVNGAVYDLEKGSTALKNIKQGITQKPYSLPVEMIAAVTDTNNEKNLGNSGIAGLKIIADCENEKLAEDVSPDPLAVILQKGLWDKNIFNDNSTNGIHNNDGIVSLSSQLNVDDSENLNLVPSIPPGYIHSGGMVLLGFSPPDVLEDPMQTVPNKVIYLLNKPVSDYTKYPATS